MPAVRTTLSLAVGMGQGCSENCQYELVGTLGVCSSASQGQASWVKGDGEACTLVNNLKTSVI